MTSSYGGLDIQFSFDPTNGTYFILSTDIAGSRADVDETPKAIRIHVETILSAGVMATRITTVLVGVGSIDAKVVNSNPTITLSRVTVRVFFYNDYVAVTMNGKWIYFYVFSQMEYPSTPVVASITNITGSSKTLYNIKRTELFDGRQAIFVDYEANGMSVIDSLIQQRPVQIFASPDGKMNFTYRLATGLIDQILYINEYSEEQTGDGQFASDGLVYFRDVDVSISEDTAKSVGFVTKLFRLSELDTGAVEAAGAIQATALERRIYIQIKTRFNPIVEMNDQINYSLIDSGTGRTIEGTTIVEGMNISVENGNYQMSISGRKVG